MDGVEARRVIRDQDQTAHERLRQLLAEWSREADAYANSMTPWLGRAWKRAWGEGGRGRIRPEALDVFRRIFEWVELEAPWRGKSTSNLKGPSSYPHDNFHSYLVNSLGDDVVSIGVGFKRVRRPEFVKKFSVNYSFGRARDALRWLATDVPKVPLPDRLLDVPDYVHAPRRGWLRRGVVARRFVEDLEEQIEWGRALEASLAYRASTPLTMHEWTRNVADLLSGLGSGESDSLVLNGFTRLTTGAAACDSPVVVDADALTRAYLTLGLIYLEEVKERMPDYEEASGQTPQDPKVSMTFSGGTFYGGQFAAQIANIDSAITGVIKQSGREVADAIKALEQAVLSYKGLDEDHRQELLDNVEYLAEAAQAPPDRRKRGMVKSALKLAALGGTALGDAMDAWSAVLDRLAPKARSCC